MKTILTILLLSFFFSCDSQTGSSSPVIKSHSYRLGKTSLTVKTFQYGDRSEPVLLHLHADETTALDAAQKILTETGGLLVAIENSDQRLINFTSGKKEYRFDPNRMFSKAGLATNLKSLNKTSPNTITDKVFQFGRFVLARIPSSVKMVIAIHNNDEGRLAINSYETGGDYEADARLVHSNRSLDPDNFFLVTDPRDFNRLKNLDQNVVLQHNTKARDDGSLSIYFGRRNQRYINVEAQHAQEDPQVEMIRMLIDSIPRFARNDSVMVGKK